MKWIKTLLAAFVAVALTSTPMIVDAATETKTDNLGREWLVDTETELTPGAGSGEGAVIGMVTETLPAYQRHIFDLQFGFGGIGIASDDSAGTEKAVSSLALMYYPPTESGWLKFGPRIGWDGAPTEFVDASKISIGIPVVAYLFPDPFTAYKWGVEIDVLPRLIVLTDPEAGGIRESAWTYIPGLMFFFEVPMGQWSAQVDVGAALPLQVEGVTDPAIDPTIEKGQFGITTQINWRLGR